MQEVINEPIARGTMGADIGSGCGYDTYLIAKKNPSVNIVSLDISDGIFETQRLTSDLTNVRVIKGSVLDMPVKNNTFDFAYSFGVLHHTPDPERALLEIFRVLKNGSPAFIYLYEDHSENPAKLIALRIITFLRRVTVKTPPKMLYILCWAMSPFVFILFSFPSKILRKFSITRSFAGKIPFNFVKGPFSLRGDLYDRFRAPVEYRYKRAEVFDMFKKCGFDNIKISKLRDIAGWVAWGYKK